MFPPALKMDGSGNREHQWGGLVTSYHHHVLGRGGSFWARGDLRCCKQRRGAASTPPAAPRAPCKGKWSIKPDSRSACLPVESYHKLVALQAQTAACGTIECPSRSAPPVDQETATPPSNRRLRGHAGLSATPMKPHTHTVTVHTPSRASIGLAVRDRISVLTPRKLSAADSSAQNKTMRIINAYPPIRLSPNDGHAPTTIRHTTTKQVIKSRDADAASLTPERRKNTIRTLLITGKSHANSPLITSAPIQDTRPDTKVPAPFLLPTHPPSLSSVSPGGRQPPEHHPRENPQGRAHGRQLLCTHPALPPVTRRPNRHPQELTPSGSSLNADDDPFSLGYQLAHGSQSGLVTHSVTPLAFTEEELEEGELSPDTEQRTSPANYPAGTSSIPTQPLRIRLTGTLSARIAPPSSAHSDVLMEDNTDYGALVHDPGFGAKAPTHHDKDPHVPYEGFNPTGPDDHAGVPFQKHAGGGARLVMSHETMMTNALQRVVDLIASDPDRFILFMPFLGGHHFHNRYRNAATDLAKQLERVTGVGGIAIYPPSADDANKANFAGNPPLPPAEVRDSVARHELIACNKDLTVHVSKVDMGRQSWCLGQFRCNSIAPLSAAIPRGAVAVHVFEQGPLRTAIAHATQNEPGSADKRVFDFAETIRATYLESPTEPIWVIYGRPFTTDHATWERFRDLFRNTKFASGLVEFTPIGSPNRAAGDNIRRLALCYICKLEDHRSDTCPYRSLTDFVGAKDVLKPGREGILALEKHQFWDWKKTPIKAQTDPAKSTAACCYLRDRKRGRFGMANSGMSAGDGGHIGPCDHTFNDGAHSGGEHAVGNSEDIPTCDEPSVGSMPGISDDEPTTATPARGDIFDVGELHAPHGPVQLGPVHPDETAASGFRTASAMTDPTGRGDTGETSPSAASTLDAHNASSAHRNGGAMLSPVRGTQGGSAEPRQAQRRRMTYPHSC
ncbi:hypothetical protein B0H14DRAFT_2590832 [Mycena olivaceomarginata]|nr:hypothetical protein B0H14DRAFT_2590832 [Mycena olivaceomarginata]